MLFYLRKKLEQIIKYGEIIRDKSRDKNNFYGYWSLWLLYDSHKNSHWQNIFEDLKTNITLLNFMFYKRIKNNKTVCFLYVVSNYY